MNAETYAAVMAEFEILCSADAEVRASRLAEIRARDPKRADTLKQLLAEHDLEQSPLEASLPSIPPTGVPVRASRIPIPIGESLGGYRLESIIGQGGMGCVYLGVHKVLGRKAALKVLRSDLVASEEFVARFLHEAKVVNEVHHANIVDIYDFITTTTPPRIAFVMELLNAPSLQAALQEHGPLSIRQARNACLQLCDALRAVHARGVVHRDLKPDNLIVVAPLDSDLDERPSIKVLDFGIAKIARSDAGFVTSTGAILGTPAYMAPEQVVADPTSPATDVYAIGEILFEMVAGRRLFVQAGLELMSRKLSDHALDLEPLGDSALAALVQACVRPLKKDRISLDELTTRLAALEVEDHRVEAQPALLLQSDTLHEMTTGTGPVPPKPKPNFVRAVAAIPLVAALGLGAALWLTQTQDAPLVTPLAPPVTAARSVDSARPPPSTLVVPGRSAEEIIEASTPTPVSPPPERSGAAGAKAASEPKRARPRTRRPRPKAPRSVPPPVVVATQSIPIRTDPSGATVRDRSSGQVLGTTPHEIELKPDEQRKLVLELTGHQKVELTASVRRPPATIRMSSTTIPIGETKQW